MISKNMDSFKTKSTLQINHKTYSYFSLPKLEQAGFQVSRLPYSLKILLENLLRHEDNLSVTKKDIEILVLWDPKAKSDQEISFMPARVILQDFTGVPAVADLAAMRDAMVEMGGDPAKINPLLPAELVIDHSVQVDAFGTPEALGINAKKEFERNQERYVFLRWGQNAFKNFKVVPPDTGIVHQVNLEYLARVVFESNGVLYPDTVVGTDSHTTMVNGLGVLGWGVGGIEAEAAMLGQAIPLLIPQVIGVKLTGHLPTGTTATDLVLTLTKLLRNKGVVEKFVEFFGAGLDSLTLADRATLANMSPEFGSTCGLFPIDEKTMDYLKLTGRPQAHIELVEAYAKAQGFFRTIYTPDPLFSDVVILDLSTIVPCIAGPKRPQDLLPLSQAKLFFERDLPKLLPAQKQGEGKIKTKIQNVEVELSHGSVVIAAITSCTNTSNPSVLIAAGHLAKKACERGLTVQPWVKTSLAPGSLVVTEYLQKAGLLSYLNDLRFNVVGYGCTTCIGNSGPLPEPITKAIHDGHLVAAAVLSGNRNFEGRINPDVQANYLASPPLVVAYAIKGHMNWDPDHEPLGTNKEGKPVYLKDIWPTEEEIQSTILKAIDPKMFQEKYAHVFEGDPSWQNLNVPTDMNYTWDKTSTYVRHPPFFEGFSKSKTSLSDIIHARVIAVLGDSVTTDHISPAGSIKKDSPAGKYLMEHGVAESDFNSYGARRGNHEVMIRGTFANPRIRNQLVPGVEGGVTPHFPSKNQLPIFDAALKYQTENVPLILLAGREYGSGSSRDWAAKGTKLLGIVAVMAESFERIHRSNLIGMGVLPLQFEPGQTHETLGLTGEEEFSITGIAHHLTPRKKLDVLAKNKGQTKTFPVICRIDTPVELDYYCHGGIMPYVLRQMIR